MNIGDIINGPFFPETIEIKKLEAFGEEYHSILWYLCVAQRQTIHTPE